MSTYPSVLWRQPISADHIWSHIRYYADVRENGQELFTNCTRSETRRRWAALNGFAQQARAYYDALTFTRGTSSGLLSYYSALNLAKADPPHEFPDQVINNRIAMESCTE